jgi:hypothetical protein
MILAQNHWDSFLQFDLKIGGYDFSDLTSKLMVMISWLSLKTMVLDSRFGPKTRLLRFGDLDLKITVRFS